MTSSTSILGIALVAIIIGFSILIYFLLKIRKNLMKSDLELLATDIWKSINGSASSLNLKQQDMLFSVPRDISLGVIASVIGDENNNILTEVLHPMGKRYCSFSLQEESFTIEFLLTWKRSAILRKTSNGEIVAKYRQTGWPGKHEIDIPNFATLKSERLKFTSKMTFHYKLGDIIIGLSQLISGIRYQGRVVLLPTNLPLEVRIFLLTV